MAGADGISGGGRSGGPTGGGTPPPIFPEDIERIRQTIRESIERLTRFEDLMRDFLASGIAQNLSNDIGGSDADDSLPPVTGPQQSAPSHPDQSDSIRSFLSGAYRLPELHPVGVSEALDAVASVLVPQPGFISRQMLNELGERYGASPPPTQPEAPRDSGTAPPQLSIVGGRMAGPIVPPQVMQVQIAPELRLNLDRGSKWVGVERLSEGQWQPSQVMAMKDGRGGVEIDTDGLEQELGTLSPELRQALNLEHIPEKPPPRASGPDRQIGGVLSGPVTQDPKGKADFIDAFGQAWLVVSFRPVSSASDKTFDLDGISSALARELQSGVNLIVDLRDIAPEHAALLKDEASRQGWTNRLKFWP